MSPHVCRRSVADVVLKMQEVTSREQVSTTDYSQMLVSSDLKAKDANVCYDCREVEVE